nr:transposase [Desulfovibrio sp. TomC]
MLIDLLCTCNCHTAVLHGYTNARLEGLNGYFSEARARGYRNVANFISMIYLIAALIGDLIVF